MKYIHLKLSDLIGQFERTMVQIFMFYSESHTATDARYVICNLFSGF